MTKEINPTTFHNGLVIMNYIVIYTVGTVYSIIPREKSTMQNTCEKISQNE